VWFDKEMKLVQKQVDAALPGLNNTIICGETCHGLPAYLVESVSDRQPREYFLYWPASGKVDGLGGAHPAIVPSQMGIRDFYRFNARDGMSIPAYVTLPPGGKRALPAPAVVMVHNGPFVRGVRWDWSADAQFLAARGYVVIEPEFRGSTGYGYALFHAGWKQLGGTMQTDLADAANWAVTQGWADRKRIGIMGAGYGGYGALMGLIRDPDVFRAGVDWAGLTDLERIFSDASGTGEEAQHYSLRTLVGDPDQDAAALKANSPINLAAQLKQPLLIAHDAEDDRLTLSTRFRDAVRRINSRVEWIEYANGVYGWAEPKNRYDFWRHVDAFLDQHLRQAQ
jgi:dipeptidyl aminopeptidase/acylaminoacyl peptidase